MRLALVAIILAASVVHGEKPKPQSNPNTQNAKPIEEPRSVTAPSVVVVNQNAAKGEKESHPSEPPSYFHELLLPQNLPSIALVGVGIAGIWVAICTLRDIRRQTGHLRRSVVASRKNAQAALLNAQAVINSERSWINVNPIHSGMGQWRFEAANHGKTPAELVSFCCRFEINLIDGLTEPPLYKDRVETYKRFVFPNAPEPTRVGVMLINSLLDACAEKDQVMSGAKAFVIIGHVVYYDVLNRVDPPHETRYCYGWNVADDALFSMGPSSYHGHT